MPKPAVKKDIYQVGACDVLPAGLPKCSVELVSPGLLFGMVAAKEVFSVF
jgi:hypothetical protein